MSLLIHTSNNCFYNICFSVLLLATFFKYAMRRYEAPTLCLAAVIFHTERLNASISRASEDDVVSRAQPVRFREMPFSEPCLRNIAGAALFL